MHAYYIAAVNPRVYNAARICDSHYIPSPNQQKKIRPTYDEIMMKPMMK